MKFYMVLTQMPVDHSSKGFRTSVTHFLSYQTALDRYAELADRMVNENAGPYVTEDYRTDKSSLLRLDLPVISTNLYERSSKYIGHDDEAEPDDPIDVWKGSVSLYQQDAEED